ncbi:lysophospholipase [Nocardioides KLBMP 9356]|uniref:Lysophospholipase n=1 Tax=Nocardioides potassii TaxID=2911371 RepID=A0ABS9HEH1_9ACTN|nr:alpha/beta fold hydrolase [Nocardioides potassii]MCF6378824.1 lysophospholipase [Nocardioides potassii]
MTHARLVPVRTPRSPEGVVILLHGGASRGEQVMVSPTQLSVLRMVPIARRIARAGRSRLAVHRLLNSHRGWDSRTTPVMDARWAIEQVRDQHGDLPVALVGHSLGGRAALLAGDDPHVRCVVALNPWVLPTDTVDLRGRRVLVVHGTDDRVALPSRSADFVRRLAAGTEVERVTIEGGRHAMLRHGRDFEEWATDFVVSTLLG